MKNATYYVGFEILTVICVSPKLLLEILVVVVAY